VKQPSVFIPSVERTRIGVLVGENNEQLTMRKQSHNKKESEEKRSDSLGFFLVII